MRVIVGLGNPGEKYRNNRHNVGQMTVDVLLKRRPPKDFIVKKTDFYMNESGIFVKKLVEQYKLDLSDLWVIHDDLDIPLGSYKIQKGKGPKIHKGLMSIDKELGSGEYWHVRIGVDNRPLESRIPGEEYVLEDFRPEEIEIIQNVIEKMAGELIGK
jgi:PTH1 family peptidyl-tRNA hydrolase